MSKEMKLLCEAVADLIVIMLIPILLLFFAPFMFLLDIAVIRERGFATLNSGPPMIGMLGIIICISMFVPMLRRKYYKFPWLFPFVKIFYMNVVITGIALTIMNYGYEIQDGDRHSVFFALTIAELVIGRILMCVWFSRNKVEYVGG